MATHNTLTSLFTDIADAIRAKTGNSEPIVADNFPAEIAGLRGGFDYKNNNITTIADYEFKNCMDLSSVDCPNIESIGVSAFEGCSNLKRVVLYENTSNVGENAFKGCSEDLVIYHKALSIPDTWHENWNPDNRPVICGELVETWNVSRTEDDDVVAGLYSVGEDYALYISGKGEMKDYEESSSRPWKDYNFTTLTVLNGVKFIGRYAFYQCSHLTTVTFLSNTHIGDYAFSSCYSLTSINMPENNILIGDEAFKYTKYYYDPSNWEDDVLYIGSHLIMTNTDITGECTIKEGTTDIGEHAFFLCHKLTSVTIPDSVISISPNAFYSCNLLANISIPNSVISVGIDVHGYVNTAFSNCQGLKTAGPIGGNYNIQFGWTESIPDGALKSCTNLTSITIPDSVTSIGYSTFLGCSNLTSITYTGTTAQWRVITKGSDWDSYTGDYTIYCTDGTISKDGTITYYEGGAE